MEDRPLEIQPLIEDLVVASHILYDQNVLDCYGHVSARDPRDPDRFLLSRARAPGLVTSSDIMLFSLDAEPVDDDDRPVFYERFIHSEIYRSRPDVHAVVHSHSPTVLPFTVTKTALRPILAAPFLYPDVPVFDTRDAAGPTNLLISSGTLGRALAEKLGSNSVVLMRGHGNTVVAPDVRTAVYRAVLTEMNAKALLQAAMLDGPITYVAPEEAEAMTASLKTRSSGHGANRTWELWAAEAARHIKLL
jgi:HCOMODA/2-hydroxy-3-carboxy-muconic semialdehyde decarboxylase